MFARKTSQPDRTKPDPQDATADTLLSTPSRKKISSAGSLLSSQYLCNLLTNDHQVGKIVSRTMGDIISNTEKHDESFGEDENRRVWNSLPIETAAYFATLDRVTNEDDFYIALRGDSYTKIFEAGIKRIGDLISLPRPELGERTALSPAEQSKVDRVVQRLGLSFDTDVSAWRAYRATVPEDFRLDVPYGTRLPKLVGSPLLT